MNHRPLKVAGVIQRVLAAALQADVPDSNAWKVNITRVTVSADLRLAKVYFNSLDGEAGKAAAEECLAAHRGLLKHSLAKKMRIKYQPEITFIWDEVLQKVEKVEEILDQLKAEEEQGS